MPDRPHIPNLRSSSLARGLALALTAGGLLALSTPPAAGGQIKQRTVEEPATADQIKSSRQRELAKTLSRRHLGTPLTGGEIRDLEIIQRLLDSQSIEREDVFEQQALGLALGDVMAQNLDLHWVVVDDDYGRSRALRWKQEEDLFFPVTLFSKRIQQGRPVEVHELYDVVADRVATLKARSLPRRRGRAVIPPRPKKQSD
ncbi:MAG: DUF3806 domain-containing protein [Myxococcota bacterium]|nr:DUF3806 domain-containing protein [Myxococcota bacterium]